MNTYKYSSKVAIIVLILGLFAGQSVIAEHRIRNEGSQIGQLRHSFLTARTPLEPLFVRWVPWARPYTSMNVTATGYSSTPEETDDTPFITASGIDVRVYEHNVIAANFLKFGTRVKIPELFGNKEFYNGQPIIDVWFPHKRTALAFGKRTVTIVILSSPDEVALATF
jgi:3D (Asp-Asp-Asp) domain-containing protein